MTYATVFLAPEPSLFYFGDPLQHVQSLMSRDLYQKIGVLFTEKTGEAAAEEMFDLSNNPSREHERAERWGRYRSLSVGDVVHVNDESFLCSAIGWVKL